MLLTPLWKHVKLNASHIPSFISLHHFETYFISLFCSALPFTVIKLITINIIKGTTNRSFPRAAQTLATRLKPDPRPQHRYSYKVWETEKYDEQCQRRHQCTTSLNIVLCNIFSFQLLWWWHSSSVGRHFTLKDCLRFIFKLHQKRLKKLGKVSTYFYCMLLGYCIIYRQLLIPFSTTSCPISSGTLLR